MRFASFVTAASLALLTGCGSSHDQSDDMSKGLAMLAVNPLSKDQAVQIMHERHEGMEATGKAAKAAGRELQGGSPDLGIVRASAKTINDFAPKIAHLVPPGTGPETGKTGAKPEIWENPADFTAKAHDFQLAAQAFNAVALGSDVGAIKAHFSQMMQTCKACHDKYRSEMHH
jgi:cytochrome c556